MNQMKKKVHKLWMYAGLFAALALSGYPVHAQQEITGKVTAGNGRPLPGVKVMLKGTDVSTATNEEGLFRIRTMTDSDVLVFSALGLLNHEEAAGNRTSISVVMQEGVQDLEEVVVVGYGTQKKVNLTGAVSVVAGDRLAERQVASASAALQGMAPGVMVTQQSGLPGSDAATVRIRGISSMFAGKDPLVLIDQVEMNMNAIDPNNIASISILKDAAAASIYGSRAANGVILITTKRGVDAGTRISYNTYTGVQRATNLPDKVSGVEHMELYDLGLQNVDRAPVFTDAIAAYHQSGPDNFTRFNTDWKGLMLTNDGLMTNHNLNVAAGAGRVKVYASGSYLKQNGLTANTTLDRFDLRLNSDVQVLSNLSASFDMVQNLTDRRWPFTSPNILMMQMIGLPASLPGKFDSGEYGEAWNNSNPVALAEAGGFDNRLTRSSVLTGTLTYRPVQPLEIMATYSSSMNRPRARSMQKQYQVYLPDVANNRLEEGVIYPATNMLDESWNESAQRIFRTQATYNQLLKAHNFQALAGFSAEDFSSISLSAGRQNFINTDMPYLNTGDAGTMINAGGISEWAILSFYSRLNYAYNDRYLVEVNGRWDASSRFAAGSRWGFFPSVSAGWRLSEEPFWSSLKPVVNEWKFRFSYGELGNQNLTSFYPTVAQFSPGAAYNYFFNNTIVSGYATTQAANQRIRWESSRQLDIGADAGFFNNRLTLTADYFKRNITDMLQVLPIPLLVGLSAPYVNAGSMENRGWELGLGWNDRRGGFSYGIQLNLSDVRNKVIDLNGEEYISTQTIIREGHPIDSYFGYFADGLFQSQAEIDGAPVHFPNTRPGDVRYRDISGPDGEPDGVIDNYDRAVLGDAFPRYEYSADLRAGWKGFDVSIFFQGVGKRDNYMSGIGAWAFHSTNFQGSAYAHHKDYWTPENPDASYPRLTVGIDNNQKPSQYWIRSGAYLRLKNAILGYTLPTQVSARLGIGELRFYVSGQNLFTWDDFYPGFDPERENNTGQFYPIMKTYSIGLTLNLNRQFQ